MAPPTRRGPIFRMTVADLQAYLTGLADATAAATRSDLGARSLRTAADALEPFAALSIDDLSALLVAAREYQATGVLPEVRGRRFERIKPTPEGLGLALTALRHRADTDPTLKQEEVESALARFRYLPHAQLRAVAAAHGVQATARMMRHSLMEALVRVVLGGRAGAPAEAVAGNAGDEAADTLSDVPVPGEAAGVLLKPGECVSWLRAALADPSKLDGVQKAVALPGVDRNELLAAVAEVYGPAVHEQAKRKSKQGMIDMLRVRPVPAAPDD